MGTHHIGNKVSLSLLGYTKFYLKHYNIVDRSTVEDHMTYTRLSLNSLKLSSVLQLRSANSYINNTYFTCSLATWGKYKGNTQSI